MRRRRGGLLTRFGRSLDAAFLALVAMALQLAVVTGHLAMDAARAAAPASLADTITFASLCVGEGSERPGPLDRSGSPPEAESCFVCATAQVAGAGLAAAPATALPPAGPVATVEPIATAGQISPSPLLRYGSTRGPPLSVLS